MKKNINIDIHHLARVEGHGDIHILIEDGELKEARWQVVETPRFFEVMLKGKHYTTAPILAARICGICSISHCLASLEATERAFGLIIPETAAKLRLLAKHGETMQSHCLHLVFLAAPDFLGIPSVLPLIESNPDVVGIAAGLKGLANRLCDLVAGRTTHPVSLAPGGVTMMPDRRKLSGIRRELENSLGDIRAVAEIFKTFEIPDFSRETEFVSLKGETGYPFIGSSMISSDGVEKEAADYKAMTNEYVDKDNTSKLCRLSRESMAVGALARFNNNHRNLHPEALKTADELGLEPVSFNPFENNLAQLVEWVHCTCEAMKLIDELLDNASTDLIAEVEPRAGTGVGVVEAPRGILYHEYEYDDKGRIVKADCVIPTTQNNANIHFDLKNLVKEYSAKGADKQELELLASMLVRSYDPCISCSVH